MPLVSGGAPSEGACPHLVQGTPLIQASCLVPEASWVCEPWLTATEITFICVVSLKFSAFFAACFLQALWAVSLSKNWCLFREWSECQLKFLLCFLPLSEAWLYALHEFILMCLSLGLWILVFIFLVPNRRLGV